MKYGGFRGTAEIKLYEVIIRLNDKLYYVCYCGVLLVICTRFIY